MRKGRDGEKTGKKTWKKIKGKIVATMSLPVDRLTAHYDLKWLKNGQKPQKIIFPNFFKVYICSFQGLYAHTGSAKKVFLGSQHGYG